MSTKQQANMNTNLNTGQNSKEEQVLDNQNKKNRNISSKANQVITYIKTSQRESIPPSERREEDTGNQNHNSKSLFKKKCIIILFFILLALIAALIIIIVHVNKSKKQKNEEDNKNDSNKVNKDIGESETGPIIINGPILTKEEVMKVFEPIFNITSKQNTLSQLLLKSTQTYNSTSNGVESSYSILSKAKYDLYTLNSTSSGEDKDFYTTKYTTVITINSICTKLLSGSLEEDCELNKYLDLNIKTGNNLRRIDENDKERIKNAILPICIIEHTDTNILISVNCPETLSSNLKNDIILAFQSIKPDSSNCINDDENDGGVKTEKKNDKIYIKSFNKICDDYDGDPTKNMTCEIIRNIITDKEGNIISSEKISTSETILANNNRFSNYIKFNVEDISQQNTGNFDPENYLFNLNIVFELTNKLMKKENYISEGTFKEIVDTLINEDNNNKENNIRFLMEEDDENPGVDEKNVFSKSIYNINMTLNMKNDIGLGTLEFAKAITNYNTGEKSQELSNNEIYTGLNETLNEFITLSKAGNKMASVLFEQLNDPLLNLRDIIINNINELNNLLAFKDLSDIFDSTLAVNDLERLSYKFVAAAQNLYNDLNILNNEIIDKIGDMKNQLKKDVSGFLKESHQLLNNIFQNLTEATDVLSSQKSKIAEISSYYLNDTDTSYVNVIQQAKEILDNYYIKEIELIEPLVDQMLSNFSESVIESLNNVQSSLDIISDKLDNGKIIIDLANAEDYKNVIKNIYNSKIKVNEIIKNVKEKFKESINIQINGYFETQKEINQNKNSYDEKSQRAMNISYTLDNNELIDKTFDKIMIYFRDQFIYLLNYMDKSKREKYPLKEDVLSISTFPSTYIKQIDNDFLTQKRNIINFVKDENNEYMNLINQKINSLKSSSGNSLEQLISYLQVELSDLNLNNLNTTYNEILSKTINSINLIIENNKNLALQYMTNIKNAGSSHRTQNFINKYNTYIYSFNQIKSFIQYNLKNNLIEKYKNVINQIRTNLQSIKSSVILKKYIKQLPFAENHLRIIDNLFTRLEKHISDALFNTKYLTKINNYVNSAINNLNSIINNLYNLYISQLSLPYSSSTNYDYYIAVPYSWKSCRRFFKKIYHCKTHRGITYKGYKIAGGENHLKLQSISNFNDYTYNFDSLYNKIYSKFSNYITSYHNTLTQLNNPLDSIKQEILNKNKNNNYLSDITNNIDSILNNKLGNNLLNSVYNYYKNDLIKKLPDDLNDILGQWKNVYDQVYGYLNTNLSNFKSSLNEFSLFSIFYLNIYSANISDDYYVSIINKVRNEFNYTIKYYYNFILSKVNKTYSYILNNMPKNDEPFDEIINLRISQIKQSYNNFINQLQLSKSEMLKGEKQLNYFKVNDNNFFSTNSYLIQNIGKIKQELQVKAEQYASLSNQNNKIYCKELVVARLYLENAQNGKQIRENYEQVNKATFIDLQNNAYQKLIEEIWEIDQDDLINNIKDSLINSNTKILNNFKYEKQKYINILQDKIYKEFYTKEDLEKEINYIYNNGLKSLDANSNNTIYGYLNEVLNRIKYHVINEANRLSDELTSYSNNYKIIENRLNYYKNSIYNKFETNIKSVVNDFYSKVLQKFHTDYIVYNLDIYKKEAIETSFENFEFLNISFNLKDVVNENLELLIKEYKELSKNQIDFFNQKHLQALDQLFIFSNMKNTINNEIDNIYNNQLLPILKQKAIYNSGDDQISDYDFKSNILVDIDNLINQKINQIKQIMGNMKGTYNIEENYNIPPDFSRVKIDEFKKIIDSFKNFTDVFYSQELKEFKNIVLQNVKNNFQIIIDNFVPSFGKDFFDRILKYNEEKIKSLYNNLKYYITESIIYYISLCQMQESNTQIQLPEDIKLKILTLNNLDETIKSKNNQIISSINSKINQFFEETKNFIVETYIDEMKKDTNIQLNFEKKIRTIIEQTLDGKRNIFENEYINMMNSIKNPFIEQYKKTLNKETNEANYVIQKIKEQSRDYLNKIFTLNPDDILLNIENKLNNTVRAVEAYNYQFNTFKISNDVYNYLNTFGEKIILPIYQNLKDLLEDATIDIIVANLNKNSEVFEKEYSIDKFDNKTNEINNNLTHYINEMNTSIKNYGVKENIYENNLKSEIANYKRIRRLEETDKQQVADLKLDKTFQELKNTSKSIKEFIQSFNLFYNFDDNINKYINDIEYQNGRSENLIKKYTLYYDELSTKLYELNNLAKDYYNKANSTYYKIKDSIIESILLINEYIEKCSDITYKTIANKYIEIKDNFNPVSEKKEDEKDSILIDNYNENAGNDLSYTIETKIEKYKIDNEFALDILFEEGDIKKPKVLGKVINKNKPIKIEINIYSLTGQVCGKIGRRINAEFNNISLSTDINFDGGLNNATINTNFDYEEYNVETNYYENVEITNTIIVEGIAFPISSICTEITREVSDSEVILSKKEKEMKTYSY